MVAARRFDLADADQTAALGATLAHHLVAGDVIHLDGDLGAGKTTLARGLITRLDPTARVKSPTYTIVEPYETRALALWHLDLYRLNGSADLDVLGLGDALDRSALLIEWPDRGGDATPPADLRIALAYTADDLRRATVTALTARGIALLRLLDQSLKQP